MSHETHCNQGEYEGSCKYGEASTCPMLKEPTPQEPDGSVPGGTATPAGCGPLEPVAYADKATYAYCIKEGKGFDVWPLIGELTNPDNVVRIYGPEAADTIAALQSLVGEDKLALGKQLAQSNAERQQLQEAVAALQAENAELRKNYNAGRTDELVKAMQIIATTPGSAAHHRIAHQALVRGDAPPFGAASLSTDGLGDGG